MISIRREPAAIKMIGAYAGEIGKTRFLPPSQHQYGVDFGGNGKVELRCSVL